MTLKRILVIGLVALALVGLAMTMLYAARSQPMSLPPAQSYPPPQARPLPPLTPIGERVDVSGRLLILNRELGIPLDQLKAMSSNEIERLFEQNAARLNVNVYRLTRQPDGTETWLEFRGIKSPTPPPTLQPKPPSVSRATQCEPIQKGLAFLKRHHIPAVGLIRESLVVAPNRAWLTNDNALAAFAFSQLGETEQSAALASSMQRYGYSTNGLIEVLWGVPVVWPPRVARPVLIQSSAFQVWQEFHDSGPAFDDWQEYANLGFLGALNEYQQGRPDSALRIFQQTLAQFDGTGLRDKAYTDHYETYKLALALYAGATIRAAMPTRPQLLALLLSMQSSDGGFTTLYRDHRTPLGDANTETTALALLALYRSGCLP